MKETSCEVIRDLLPLYEDNAVNEDTAKLVREHLKDCPECREELRKMRTPISLPPSEDEEAVRRFLEHRAEIRKKQNVKIACVTSVLAVLIVFCLCYTLIPRSWNSVAGTASVVKPDRIMGTYTVFTFHEGDPGIDTWQIDENHGIDAGVIDAAMDVLYAVSYRAELRNVLNYTPLAPFFQDRSTEGLKGSIFLYLVKDNAVILRLYLFNTRSGQILNVGFPGKSIDFYYRVDSLLFDTLTALIQEYGTLQ